MADVFTPEKRSWVMSRIRGRGTRIEIIMGGILDDIGCPYEAQPRMFGNPDFVIWSERIAIFCDGDFWHGYDFRRGRRPDNGFWRDKIEGNMKRDALVSRRLRREGWSVLRFWEHVIKKNPAGCGRRIERKIGERRSHAGADVNQG